MLKNNSLIALITVVLVLSCTKVKYYPDEDHTEIETKVLAHRAGGGEISLYPENTLEAARLALETRDGVEVDLQISKDGTLWLSHDADLFICGSESRSCFPEVNDSLIVLQDSCNGDSLTYSRLEDVFALIASEYSDKYISLDVKAWFPCGVMSLDYPGLLSEMASAILFLTKKYSLQDRVMVESDRIPFISLLKNNNLGIDCYLLAYGDFETALQVCLEFGFSGISYKFDPEEELSLDHIQLLRSKGLKIQLWTVNEEDELRALMDIHPDFIQTENLDFIPGIR